MLLGACVKLQALYHLLCTAKLRAFTTIYIINNIYIYIHSCTEAVCNMEMSVDCI